jgi:FlgD Ig-like domain
MPNTLRVESRNALPPKMELVFGLCCLIINEIGHAPADAKAEFVEILNTGAASVDATTLTIYDQRSGPRSVTDRPTVVPPGGYLVLVRDASAFAQEHPGVPFVAVSNWPTLNNSGDRIGLAILGIEVDAVPYEGTWGTPGHSLERKDPSGPSWHAVNWTAGPPGGTPGRQNAGYMPDREGPKLLYADRLHPDTVFAVFDEPVQKSGLRFEGAVATHWIDDESVHLTGVSGSTLVSLGAMDLFGNTSPQTEVSIAGVPSAGDLVITERLTRPLADRFDGRPDQPLFLEIQNQSRRMLSVRRLALVGKEDESGNAPRAPLPFVSRALWPSDVLLISNSQSNLEAAFGLSKEMFSFETTAAVLRDESVSLVDGLGETLDRADYHASWHAPSIWEVGNSLTRIGPDGRRPTSWMTSVLPGRDAFSPEGPRPTPGVHVSALTSLPPIPGDIVISEVLFHAAPGGVEFIELQMRRQVDLNGLYFLVDRSPAMPDSARLAYAPFAPSPGSFVTAVVPTTGVPLAELVGFAREFYPNAPQAARWLPLRGLGALRNAGVDISLIGANDVVLDHVVLSADNHHPALADPAGISLERVDPLGSSREPTNWTSSSGPYGATPGEGPEAVPTPGGRFLEVLPRAFSPDEGPVTVSVNSAPQETVQIEIYTRAGLLVRRMNSLARGPTRLYWDGTSDAGTPVRAGVYVVLARVSTGHSAKALVVVARR